MTAVSHIRKTPRVTRHPKFYQNGGDLHLLIRGQLFRVNGSLFEAHSTAFPPPANCGHITNRGDSDQTAISVDVDPHKFEKFLSVFCEPAYSLYGASMNDWTDVLELAHEWSFSQVMRLATHELEKCEISTAKRIALYRKYDVDSRFMVPLYAELCTRPEILSIQEARRLEMPATIIILRLREEIRTPPPSVVGPVSVENIDQQDIYRRVTEAFGFPPEAANGPERPRTVTRAPLNSNGRTTDRNRNRNRRIGS